MNNQTQLVRNAINIFIIVAVSFSLFQQLMNATQKPITPLTSGATQTGQSQSVPSLQPTGPKLQGIRIQSSDKFQTPLKQVLAKNNLNIQITQYEFQGNQYWISLVVNWGHMVLIFFFMTKHRNETDQGAKTKIMIVGALAVVAWFYFSPQLKPQRFAIQVHGSKVYEKDYFNDEQIVGVLNDYEFELDDLKQAQGSTIGTQKIDAWGQQEQEKRQKKEQVVEEQFVQLEPQF